ncbi:tRNA(adenine34) deaminase [Fistulifera solaris]|uniref:tRNA(adenine(34)) deaminase n=1 Tax=Fistulifera solaris TaxID=1519565 RepID=A0A1Z5KNE3_FISSO|nr:tRNA(adenine34) deaminase [Fistulifera solaris]|eukprot:GAX27635.1 tRNA(adenine34) deaminase [Fistulifera solaris]
MKQALEQARKVGKQGEVPIGAAIVRNDTISSASDQVYTLLSAQANQVETRSDASAHAELVSLRQAAARQRNWRLLNCTLYSTLEPCAMCLSAALAFRIDSIVYGAPDLRLGAIVTHQQLLNQSHPFHAISAVVSGVLEEESAELLRNFFRERRQQQGSQVRRPVSGKNFLWKLRKH